MTIDSDYRLIRTMKAAPRGDCGFISCAVGMHFLGSEYAELLRSSGSPLSNVNDVYLSNYCGYEAPTSSSLLRKTLVQRFYADLKFVLVETKKAAKEAELADGEWKDLKSKRLSDFDEPNGLRENDIVVLAADFEAATGIGFLSCYHYVRVTSTDPHGDVRCVETPSPRHPDVRMVYFHQQPAGRLGGTGSGG